MGPKLRSPSPTFADEEAIGVRPAVFDGVGDEAPPFADLDARHRRDASSARIEEEKRLTLIGEAIGRERSRKPKDRGGRRRVRLARKGRIVEITYDECPCARSNREAIREGIARACRRIAEPISIEADGLSPRIIERDVFLGGLGAKGIGQRLDEMKLGKASMRLKEELGFELFAQKIPKSKLDRAFTPSAKIEFEPNSPAGRERLVHGLTELAHFDVDASVERAVEQRAAIVAIETERSDRFFKHAAGTDYEVKWLERLIADRECGDRFLLIHEREVAGLNARKIHIERDAMGRIRKTPIAFDCTGVDRDLTVRSVERDAPYELRVGGDQNLPEPGGHVRFSVGWPRCIATERSRRVFVWRNHLGRLFDSAHTPRAEECARRERERFKDSKTKTAEVHIKSSAVGCESFARV